MTPETDFFFVKVRIHVQSVENTGAEAKEVCHFHFLCLEPTCHFKFSQCMKMIACKLRCAEEVPVTPLSRQSFMETHDKH